MAVGICFMTPSPQRLAGHPQDVVERIAVAVQVEHRAESARASGAALPVCPPSSPPSMPPSPPPAGGDAARRRRCFAM